MKKLILLTTICLIFAQSGSEAIEVDRTITSNESTIELEEPAYHWEQVPYCVELWDIQRACEEQGYDDWLLAFSISRLETGNFTSKAYMNGNWGGISYNEVPKDYDGDFYKGLEEYINLLISYRDEGRVTVEEIGKHWCPVNYDNWVRIVKQIMEETECILAKSSVQ